MSETFLKNLNMTLCGFGGRDKKGDSIEDSLHSQSLSEQKLKDMSPGPDGPHERGHLRPRGQSERAS